MEQLLARPAIAWLLSNLTPNTIAVLFASFFISVIAFKINKAISEKDRAVQERIERLELLERRVHKNQQLFIAYPCISKTNASWLQDDDRNGGAPPGAIVCPCGVKFSGRLSKE